MEQLVILGKQKDHHKSFVRTKPVHSMVRSVPSLTTRDHSIVGGGRVPFPGHVIQLRCNIAMNRTKELLNNIHPAPAVSKQSSVTTGRLKSARLLPMGVVFNSNEEKCLGILTARQARVRPSTMPAISANNSRAAIQNYVKGCSKRRVHSAIPSSRTTLNMDDLLTTNNIKPLNISQYSRLSFRRGLHTKEHKELHSKEHKELHSMEHKGLHSMEHKGLHSMEHKELHSKEHKELHNKEHKELHSKEHKGLHSMEHKGLHSKECKKQEIKQADDSTTQSESMPEQADDSTTQIESMPTITDDNIKVKIVLGRQPKLEEQYTELPVSAAEVNEHNKKQFRLTTNKQSVMKKPRHNKLSPLTGVHSRLLPIERVDGNSFNSLCKNNGISKSS